MGNERQSIKQRLGKQCFFVAFEDRLQVSVVYFSITVTLAEQSMKVSSALEQLVHPHTHTHTHTQTAQPNHSTPALRMHARTG